MSTPITEIQDLFKISQEGSIDAVNFRGISLESLMASLMFSTIYCGVQLIVFYYLQTKFPEFYDKYNYDQESKHKSTHNSNESRRTVIQFCLYHIRKRNDISKFLDIEEYRRFGLDSYLFLRFLRICLYFFVGISMICLPILIPVNYLVESTESDNSGLDLISIINITSDSTYKYIFHFLITIFIVFWFHYILIHEINFYINLKTNFDNIFIKHNCGKRFLKTMYLENINIEKYSNIKELKNEFEKIIPNCIEKIYPIYYSERLIKLTKRRNKLKNLLERYYWEIWRYKNGETFKIPNNTMKLPIKILNSDYEITIIGISYTVNKSNYLEREINKLNIEIKKIKNKFQMNEKLNNPLLLSDKIFIQFKNISNIIILNQIEINIGEKNYYNSNFKLTDINPRDINWENLFMFHNIHNNNKFFFNNIKECFILLISIIVIVCWVIPISCIGTLLQLNILTMLIPTIKWIKNIPQILQDFISWILPTIILTFFTSFGLIIFRYLSSKRRNITNSKIEINNQTWVFIFLFFQLFIVITISSGFIIILQKLILNPISIPMILAIDFPKASIFFTLFFIIKGLSLVGNNILQFYNLIKKIVINDLLIRNIIKYKTEKEIINEDKKYLYEVENYWGQTYSTFSVYGCIGIVYSIISPSILIFCCINFTLDLIGYKYSIRYSLNRTNKSETYGKMYIKAIKQMYAGIYSLEFFEIGLFISVKDTKGDRSCITLSILMMFILVITIYMHLELNQRYEWGLCGLPKQHTEDREDKDSSASDRERYLPQWLRTQN